MVTRPAGSSRISVFSGSSAGCCANAGVAPSPVAAMAEPNRVLRCIMEFPSAVGGADLRHGGFERRLRHEARDVAAQPRDFLHKAGSDELVCLGGHQKDGLDVLVQAAVHADHLELV